MKEQILDGVRRSAARVERHATLRRHRFPQVTKFDIVNRLGSVNEYASYLEVATPTTGNKYASVDRTVFSDCRRVIYRTVPEAAEFPNDVASTSLDCREGVSMVADVGESFDVVFVDPHHDRSTSRVDIEQGLDVLAPGGTMVVHDCLPPRKSMAGQDFEHGEWLGQTYLAFLDVMSERRDLDSAWSTRTGVSVLSGAVRKAALDVEGCYRPAPMWEASTTRRGPCFVAVGVS